MFPFHVRLHALALACAATCLPLAHAQGVATDNELAPVVVTGSKGTARSGLPAGLPGSTATKTFDQLRDQNLVNPEDALQYQPNTTVRKRYIGDRNALVAGRSFGTLQPSRALVYLDGYLISNFLGRFDAPRWNMISPEAIERVDMLYGPYSALLPGNSMGTTVAVSQRAPKGLEVSGRVIAARQSFDQYGHKDHYDAQQMSLHLGQRLDTGLWFSGDVNHQDSTSQPMQYGTGLANASGVFVPPTNPSPTAVTPVTGVVYDTDPKGLKRAIFGANAGAIDQTVQDTVNLRAGYRFTPTVEGSVMASWWGNQSKTRNVTFLRDANGDPVWKGDVSHNGNIFRIVDSSFAPSTRDESHQQLGATVKTRNASGWNGSMVISDYRILNDEARQASQPDPVALSSGGSSGTLTRRDGTGWNTFEVQGTWTPSAGDWTDGRHALAFGLHRNAYKLDNTVADTTNWRQGEGTLSQYYRGKTEVIALYAQDAWRLQDDLKLTLGWREEQFRALDGRQFALNQAEVYPRRTLRGHSPKAALAWSVRDDLILKLSAGRGVRFPNVEELYNGTVTSTARTFSDPDLRAETSDAVELSAEKTWDAQRLRVSLFHEDVKDAILRQSTTDATVCKTNTVALNYTCVQNVDRVKTSGIEFAWQAQDLFIRGLSLDTTLAFTHAKVAANAKDPTSVGKWWLRVPKERATVQAGYQLNADWRFSAGYRHEGRAYNDVYNLDINPHVYGGVSSVNQLDLRGSHQMTRQLELALGVNNALDARAYQSHPYPGRTLFAELRFKL
ncbi:TonB-dependent receptor [Aquabacterium sp. CECT 9606]|uniref:TonB-dependent receptor n=1 Tax=Aquabacterium sp. CECT 9606 TaxID=2845822 RepID=UPI001E367396|nr:TonB-dependent receptor [Aquabacterium sp. CECT 9606]CAH0347953.1 Vitamin B12 transporter BtuB [Aquabacterium sp. CECT 9606]